MNPRSASGEGGRSWDLPGAPAGRIWVRRAVLALALAAAGAGGLRTARGDPDLPARVFTPFDGRVYIEAAGYLDPGGFRAYVTTTPFFRTLNPAFAANGTPDEIAAVAGKILITPPDWQRFLASSDPKARAEAARLAASSETYQVAGVAYLAVRLRSPSLPVPSGAAEVATAP
jgi:hypothetical protein